MLAVALVALIPAAASANTYSWNSSFGGYVDDNCGTSNERFQLVMYRDINGGGPKVKIYQAEPNFCYVPLTNGSDVYACGVFTYLPLNDQASSAWAKSLPSGYCIIMATHSMYNGTILSLDYEGQFVNLTNWSWANDSLSSARRNPINDSLCQGPA